MTGRDGIDKADYGVAHTVKLSITVGTFEVKIYCTF